MSDVQDFGCAIIDLFGHAQLAGYLLRDGMCGADLLRVDVPTSSDRAGFTRYIGLKAIYSLTLVDETAMHCAARNLRERAVTTYLLPEDVVHFTLPSDDYEEGQRNDDDEVPY